MNDIRTELTLKGLAEPIPTIEVRPLPAESSLYLPLISAAAFGLYWFSSFLLEARYATTNFGADAHLYTLLANGTAVDRITRFHPVTVAAATVWMKLFSPISQWIPPHQLLKAMFAAIGAIGVWAAMSAFSTVISRRYAALFGMIYAASFGVWYFSSIEESKIVTASLSAIYIASYLHLRERWTRNRVIVLTAVLLVACLNEIISCFLMIIPVVDTLVRRGFDWRRQWWLAAHGLMVPIAYGILEGVINARMVTSASDAEGASHIRMLIYYIFSTNHSLSSLYAFVLNWFLFNIAAPSAEANYLTYTSPTYGGYFEPNFLGYFSGSASGIVVLLLGVIAAISLLSRRCADGIDKPAGIVLGLAAYVLLRGTFFFIFNPPEPLLFSPAITLALMLIVAMPFAVSNFPAKRELLAATAALLLVGNSAFFIGH